MTRSPKCHCHPTWSLPPLTSNSHSVSVQTWQNMDYYWDMLRWYSAVYVTWVSPQFLCSWVHQGGPILEKLLWIIWDIPGMPMRKFYGNSDPLISHTKVHCWHPAKLSTKLWTLYSVHCKQLGIFVFVILYFIQYTYGQLKKLLHSPYPSVYRWAKGLRFWLAFFFCGSHEGKTESEETSLWTINFIIQLTLTRMSRSASS